MGQPNSPPTLASLNQAIYWPNMLPHDGLDGYNQRLVHIYTNIQRLPKPDLGPTCCRTVGWMITNKGWHF